MHLSMETDNHRTAKGGHLPGQELNRATSGVEQAKPLQLARILEQIDALLSALKQYGKLGRYASDFPEKPYFLFSQCSRLLYDFQIARQGCGLTAKLENDHLVRLLDRLNFGRLQHFDGTRQAVAPTSGQQFKNESEWYRFWFEVIEATEHLAGTDLTTLQQSLLECVGAHGVLISKLDKSARRTVAKLFRTPAAGRFVVHSEWILEDICNAITSWLARLGAREHALAQAQSLACALKQIRRHLLWHAAATGPYALTQRHCWGAPGGLAKYRLRGTRGRLATRLQDEDGSILCVYEWEDNGSSQQLSWPQDVKVLEGNYEKALHATWSYDTGDPVIPLPNSPLSPAQWKIGSVEAGYLEFVSQRAELLNEALARHAPHEPIITTIGDLLKEGADGRRAGSLRWTYVKEMDGMIQKLESSWRPRFPQ